MIEQVLDYIHNYFVKEKHYGEFTIENGELVSIDFLQNGQYFKIIGSIFNNGVHKFPDDILTDEIFTGEIWAMAVPPAVVALSDEIDAWMDKYGESVNSPYQSESFGGYSYSKGSVSSSNGTSDNVSWQNIFRNRLNAYRKLS